MHKCLQNRTMITDRLAGIDVERMRKYRLDRTKAAMRQFGIGTLLIFDGFDIRYTTSCYPTVPVRWIERQFAVIPINGDPHYFGNWCGDADTMNAEAPWMKGNIHPPVGGGKQVQEVDDVVRAVMEIVHAHNLQNMPVGLDGCTRALAFQAEFAKYGVSVCDGQYPMMHARSIKNEDEIECIRMASTFADAAFTAIKKKLEPGVRENEIMAVGMQRLYEMGADETWEFSCSSGPRTNPLHIDCTDRIIQAGDILIVDINAASYLGYKTCYYRDFCCGKATQEQKDDYEICRKILYDGMSAIKAGNTNYDVAAKWPNSPAFWGRERWDQVGLYAVAHGIGITLHDFPSIRSGSIAMGREPEFKFEEGQVIAIETWYGKPGGNYGFRLEECVAVTKDGYDLLTHYPIDYLTECL